MAAMQFSCPHCSGLFQVDTSFGGQQISCPHCRGVVTLPALGPQSVAPSVHPQPTGRQQQPRPVTPTPQPGASPQYQRPAPRPITPAPSGAPGVTTSPHRPVTPVSQGTSASTTASTIGVPRGTGGAATPISIPTADNPLSIKIREPVKTVGFGDDAVELNSLSPENRARWRLKKNLILWAFGLIVIGIVVAVLLLLGPIRI